MDGRPGPLTGRDGAAFAEYADYLRDAGVTEQWGPESFRWTGESPIRESRGVKEVKPLPAGEYGKGEGELYPGLREVKTLDGLREFIGDCKRCKLCEGELTSSSAWGAQRRNWRSSARGRAVTRT